MPKDPYQYFRPEARELLEQLNRRVLELETGRADAVPQLLRLAHTLKGAARVVKQGAIADHAHAIEDALAPFRESAAGIPPERIDALLKMLDAIAALISVLGQTQSPDAAQSAKPAPDGGFRHIRAGVAEMEALLDGITESHAQLSALRRTVASVDRGRHLADLLVQHLAPRSVVAQAFRPAVSGGPEGPHYTGGTADDASTTGTSRQAYSAAGELRQVFGGIERRLQTSIDQMERELRQVREAAEQLRLIPAGAMFTSLERTARDAARTLGKSVRFEARGAEVRLETQVVTVIEGALLQLTRNAVAHGIESERDRKAADKAPAGRVTVDILRRGRHVVFRCEDDGRGIDVDEVRRVAARKGLSSLQTGALDAEDLTRLLLRGGISTSSAVTEVSGRGIGLDIVRNAAERLRGNVTVVTKRGKGATFDIVVPLFVSSVEALIVEAGGQSAAIPLDSVRQARRVTAAELSRTPGSESLVHGGKTIPFVALQRVLHGRSGIPRSSRTWSAVIVESATGFAAVGVDRLLGKASIVVRPLPDQVAAAGVVVGASFGAEGDPQLVLDPDGLVAEAQRDDEGHVEPSPVPPQLLVIDDSLTTRMLEKSILESAGFDVDTAISAEEALDSARRKPYALFLVDIEMPGMDGFSFITEIRSDPALRHVPAILVSSRSSPEDRQRGVEVGAQGYIAKDEFNQAQLLGHIRRLTGHGENTSSGGRRFSDGQKTSL
jgi:two-component system, chemotaxis family, sensor kinase CheA